VTPYRRPMIHQRRTWAGAVVAAVAGMLLAACGGAGDDALPSESATPTETISSEPTPSGPGIPEGASPLSGRPDGADKPLLAVKIDNTRAAQPHAGLAAADLVYVQEVEWGLTRLVAIFGTQMPDIVGPVRSARVGDIGILGPFGQIPFAFSGSQSLLKAQLAQADFIDASANASYTGWFDDPARRGPIDHMIRPEAVLGVFSEGALARDIGWVFSQDPPPGGVEATEAEATWGSSSIGFRWDPQEGNYIVIMDGAESRSAEGGPQRAATVILQSVVQTDSGFGDRYGGVTPAIETVGSGKAMVLRDGRVWEVTWERPELAEGTRYLLPDGSPIPFAIGQEWIVLLDAQRTPIVR
jgi:hypothetical protein